jgi:S-adenosylmethionine synthetase
MSPHFHPAEAVFPGHPDKLCDAIADALVQEASRREKRARCAVEVAVHRERVLVTGRIACSGAETIDIPDVVRSVYASAGYGGDWFPAPEQLHVAAEVRLEPLKEGQEASRHVAADQSIATGYAIDLPGCAYLPPEHWLAWRLGQNLQRLREGEPSLRLGPAGKVLVVLEEGDESYRLSAVSVTLQQARDGPEVELHQAVRSAVQEEIQESVWRLPGFSPLMPEEIHVNGAGTFGEAEGDTGLTGKQRVVDAYGPHVPLGGGALSGKDFYHPDRAGALLARRLAKAVVLTGAASACTATLAFFPGQEGAPVLSLRNEAGLLLDAQRWSALLDLSLAGTGDRWTNQTDLVEVARQGHFTSPQRPWERISLDGETAEAVQG